MLICVNGVQLYYEKQGSGRPLVLLHGNGEDGSIFDAALPLLSRQFTCYTVDSRDHGRSQRVNGLHYQDMADDMTALLEALDLNDVVFYGYSDGGIVGLLTAMQSERISTLIISGTNLNPHGMLDEVYEEIRLDYERTGSQKDLLMLAEPDIHPDELRSIRIPTLVLAGSEDLIKEEHTRAIADALPCATLRILPGEGDGSYIMHSDKIARLILSFLGGQKEDF